MIYTCTFNPAVDYKFDIDNLQLGKLNRIKNEYYEIGGKGIMVSKLLNNLDIPSKAIGFLAGFTGEHIRNELKKYVFIHDNFIKVDGNSRINMKLKHMDDETEINGSGPTVIQEDFDRILDILGNIYEDDYFVISGSAPNGIENAYEQMANSCKGKKINYVVDTSGSQLLVSLKCKPFLVKPNIHELEEISNQKLAKDEDIVKECRKLIKLGAKNVLLSRGNKGAILVTKENSWKIAAPSGKVLSTTGAGDSMLAGFIANYIGSKDIISAFKFSVACGSATAFSKIVATKAEIELLVDNLKVEEIL